MIDTHARHARKGRSAGMPVVGPEGRQIHGLRVHARQTLTPQAIAALAGPIWNAARCGGRNLVRVRRGWLGGPHLEVCVVGEASAPVPWSRIAETVGMPQWEAERLDPEHYLGLARHRGRLEAVEPPFLPYRGHGDRVLVREEDPDEMPTARRLGQVVEAILAPATMHSLETVAAEPAAAGRVLAEILAVVAATHPMGAGYGAFSLRSHAEALMLWGGRPDERRRAFSARHRAQAEAFTSIVASVISGKTSAEAGRWTRQVSYAAGTVDHCVQRGELTAEDVDLLSARPADSGAADADAGRDHPDTEFHRTVHDTGRTDEAGRWFAGYRLLVNAVYAQLPLLGITPMQRAFTCFAVAEAIDEVEGVSWTERLKEGL